MSPFWSVVWRVYDRPSLVRLLPRRVAPWLFGKMIGSKGRRTRWMSAQQDSTPSERQSVVIYCPSCQRDLYETPRAEGESDRIPADAPCASCDDSGRTP